MLERAEQAKLIRWFKLQYPGTVMFAIPNGGKRGIIEAQMLVLEGVTSGVPDLFLAKGERGLNGLFIEMKRPKVKGKPNPVVSRQQQAMIAYLLANSYGAVICYGFEEAKTVIVDYLD